MDASSVREGMKKISQIIAENGLWIKLDEQNGDGDLGVSMSEGFAAAAAFVESTEETDLGKIFMQTEACSTRQLHPVSEPLFPLHLWGWQNP